MIRVSYISYVLLWFPSNIVFKQQISPLNITSTWGLGLLPSLFGLTATGFSLPVLDSVHLECGCPAESQRIHLRHWSLNLTGPSLTITDHHWPSLTIISIDHLLTIIDHHWPLSFSIEHEVPWNETPMAHLWNGTMASGRHCSRATLHIAASPCQPMAWPDLGACRLETQSKAMGSLREQWNCSGQKLICF